MMGWPPDMERHVCNSKIKVRGFDKKRVRVKIWEQCQSRIGRVHNNRQALNHTLSWLLCFGVPFCSAAPYPSKPSRPASLSLRNASERGEDFAAEESSGGALVVNQEPNWGKIKNKDAVRQIASDRRLFLLVADPMQRNSKPGNRYIYLRSKSSSVILTPTRSCLPPQSAPAATASKAIWETP